MKHPLHYAIGEAIYREFGTHCEVVRDEACGGTQHIPLFCGDLRSRRTQLCKVDLLLAKFDKVRVIVEIEESGFNPTKICGKFLTSAFASHFIHGARPTKVYPYSNEISFIQVLDGSKLQQTGTRKHAQCKMIEDQICNLIEQKDIGITKYLLFVVDGTSDTSGLSDIMGAIAEIV